MKFEAVNNVIILKKDREESFEKVSTKDMRQIPPPYTGVVDSIGYEGCEYNIGDRVAFNEMGGKLSFALCMLDKKNDGFVLNAMHSREGCYTYIKDIVNGTSTIELSENEKEALNNAMKS